MYILFSFWNCWVSLAACLLSLELNLFLIALSVRPCNTLAISHHLFPILWCIWRIILSSSGDHFSFLILGSRWLCHLSLHCLPILPGRASATADQFLGPLARTCYLRILSSSLVQGPLLANEELFSSNQRLKHWISDLSLILLLTLFQRCSPSFSTSCASFWSYRVIERCTSSSVQRAFRLEMWGLGALSCKVF